MSTNQNQNHKFRLYIIPWYALVLSIMALVFREARAEPVPNGWETWSPRQDLAPNFTYLAQGGLNGGERWVIHQDQREGQHGKWIKRVSVAGGQHYTISVSRRSTGVQVPRISAFTRIHWRDERNRSVPEDEGTVSGYLQGWKPNAEPDFPRERGTDSQGWTRIQETIHAPGRATHALIEFNALWAPNSTIEWSGLSFDACPPPQPRKVRLASVHYRPSGRSVEENRREFLPFIEDATRQKADLIVLGEVLTHANTKLRHTDVAETIPGPSTEFFGDLARKHNTHIVAGLLERDGNLVYNVAVLIGPEGVLGKYRKVCLPENEIDVGITAGSDFPVFATRFGKVGMMICYDGFFPEVAGKLTANGAEVIAWPVWGCNTNCGRARAVDNQVYVVSSTYEPPNRNWGISGVVDPTGETLAAAQDWGTVVVTEVDLAKRVKWNALGDFTGEMWRARPVGFAEPSAR